MCDPSNPTLHYDETVEHQIQGKPGPLLAVTKALF